MLLLSQSFSKLGIDLLRRRSFRMLGKGTARSFQKTQKYKEKVTCVSAANFHPTVTPAWSAVDSVERVQIK